MRALVPSLSVFLAGLALGVATHHAFTSDRHALALGCLIAGSIVCSILSYGAWRAARLERRRWSRIAAAALHGLLALAFVQAASTPFYSTSIKTLDVIVAALSGFWAFRFLLPGRAVSNPRE
jgi:hypothetical protein